MTIYARAPFNCDNGIPIYSKVDRYVANYDQIATDHLEHFVGHGHNPFMSEDHWSEIESSTSELVSKYLGLVQQNPKILDVGVGMGRLLEQFPEIDRYGMDISLDYLRHAEEKGITVCMSKIEDMPYKLELFDLVVCTDVLEHVFDLNLAITEILKTLKNKGYLIIRVPYREELYQYTRADFPYEFVHLRNFDENSLKLLFGKIFNLKVLEYNLSGCLDGPFRFWLPPLPKLKGAVKRLVGLARFFGSTKHLWIAKRFNRPTEINIVLQKKSE